VELKKNTRGCEKTIGDVGRKPITMWSQKDREITQVNRSYYVYNNLKGNNKFGNK